MALKLRKVTCDKGRGSINMEWLKDINFPISENNHSYRKMITDFDQSIIKWFTDIKNNYQHR